MGDRSSFRSRRAACATLAAVAASAPAVAQQGDEALSADDAPREAQVCLDHPTIRRTRVLDSHNIVFITRRNEIYANRLPEECPSLGRGSLVNYPIEHRRLCAGGSFQVLWQTSPNNYIPAFVCQLGYFVPITESELEDLVVETDRSRDRGPRRRSSREAVRIEQVELPQAEGAPAATDDAGPGGRSPAPARPAPGEPAGPE
jgi:hypothetical protein